MKWLKITPVLAMLLILGLAFKYPYKNPERTLEYMNPEIKEKIMHNISEGMEDAQQRAISEIRHKPDFSRFKK